jgi:hypothetical protein
VPDINARAAVRGITARQVDYMRLDLDFDVVTIRDRGVIEAFLGALRASVCERSTMMDRFDAIWIHLRPRPLGRADPPPILFCPYGAADGLGPIFQDKLRLLSPIRAHNFRLWLKAEGGGVKRVDVTGFKSFSDTREVRRVLAGFSHATRFHFADRDDNVEMIVWFTMARGARKCAVFQLRCDKWCLRRYGYPFNEFLRARAAGTHRKKR